MQFDVIYVAVSTAIFVVMLVVGLSQSWDGYLFVRHHIRTFLLGLGLQLIALPLMAYVVVRTFQLPDVYAVGLVLMALSPCGASSSAFCMLAGARMELSLCLTTCTSLLAFATIPIGTTLLLGNSLQFNTIQILAQLFLVLFVPICLGALIRRFFYIALAPALYQLKQVALYLLVAIFIYILYENMHALLEAARQLFIPCGLLAGLAFTSAYGISKLIGTDARSARTIAIQVGMQNGTTALAVIITDPALRLSAIPVAYYSVFAFLLSFGFCYLWKTDSDLETNMKPNSD